MPLVKELSRDQSYTEGHCQLERANPTFKALVESFDSGHVKHTPNLTGGLVYEEDAGIIVCAKDMSSTVTDIDSNPGLSPWYTPNEYRYLIR